jgi:arylsulfatase A-like enzyme
VIPRPKERPSAVHLAGMGALVALGWSTFDVALFATSGDARAVLELLPGWIAAAVLGAGLLLVGGRLPWLLWALAVVSGAVACAQHFRWLHATLLETRLTQALFLVVAASLAARLLERLVGKCGLRGAFACGLLASQALTVLHQGWLPHHRVFLPLALVTYALGFLPRSSWRVATTVLALAAAAQPIASRARTALHASRPDLGPPEAPADTGRPNVVLIVMDTVRADRLSCYGYHRPTTPGLDAFARDHATLYERARSTTSWTLPSHASLLTGLPSGAHGADHPRGEGAHGMQIGTMRPACRIAPDIPTLAEHLRAAGYRTGAVVANDAYLDHRFGLDRGFERYDDRQGSYVEDFLALPQLFGWKPRVGHLAYRDAPRIFGLARDWVDSLGDERPFFLMVNLMDAHLPVVPPPPFDRAFAPSTPRNPFVPDKPEMSLQYDRGIAFLDAEITGFLRWLEETGRFDDSVVVVTADHGEAFGEHRGFYSHAWLLYEELLHVPLLVKPAGPRETAVEPRPFGLTEIFALVLRLVGLPQAGGAEAAPMTSEWYRAVSNPEIDLWAREAGHDLGSDYVSWLEGDRKFIVSSAGSVECYDLALDPGEERPLELDSGETARALEIARAWWDAHPPLAESELAETPGADELERMRALGYAGGDPGSDG